VEILRDAEGIPHIFAKSDADAWFALGYAHAQDRLWQMEFQRRVGRGRLSEFLGERAFDTDKLMRTLGIAKMAERIVARLDPDTAKNLEAYCAGVNAVLDADPVLPVEFHAFHMKPERWRPADTVAWLLVMAWDLSANWRTELARMRFAAKLGPERANEIIPPYPGDVPIPLSPTSRRSTPSLRRPPMRCWPHSRARTTRTDRTARVVSGARSETGKPLLANDPHLGLQAPSLWYFAHVSSPSMNVVGGTLPGVPFIVAGTQRLRGVEPHDDARRHAGPFRRAHRAGRSSSYVTPTGSAKFETRDEVIRVGSDERRITVRTTRHGPVISDAVRAAGRCGAEGPRAGARVGRAHRGKHGPARRIDAEPRAERGRDAQGRTRFHGAAAERRLRRSRGAHRIRRAARVPIRRADNAAQGRVPVPGWDAKYDWQGFLSYEQMPAIADPPSGKIVTANNKITPPGYKPFMSVDWFPPYRADRIEEMLAQAPKHSMKSFARMQGDVDSRLRARAASRRAGREAGHR